MSGETVGRVPIDRIDYHQHNVRVDLGDLRDLAASIKRFGVMQPVVLERRGERLRIRAGHRRVAAARLAGLDRIPAIIHADALEDDEWLTAAVHENTRRRGLDAADKARTIAAMRAEGMSWDGIAEAFGVGVSTVRHYFTDGAHEPTRVEERSAVRGEQVASLTRQGLSAAEIGHRLGVTGRTAARYRTDNRSVSFSRLRGLIATARDEGWTAAQILGRFDEIVAPRTEGAA